MKDGIKIRLKVWDLPTRVFHWVLALLAVAMLVTGKMRGDALEWHARLGYAVATLLLFRLAWGFAGGHWSRFASFLPSPRRAWLHLRGALPGSPGHSALGAWSVYAMLLFFLLQVASGLFVQTKEDFAGPLSPLVSNATAKLLTGYHKNIGQPVLISLVILHLVAIAWYALRGAHLVAAMLTGDREIPGEVDTHIPASRDDASSRAFALVVLALCAGAVAAIVKLGS